MEKNTLSLSQCKVYVKIIRDLELSCYQQSRLIEKVQYKINEVINSVPKDKIVKPSTNPLWIDVLICLVLTGIGALIGGLIGMIFLAPLKGTLIGGGIVGGYCIISFLFMPLMVKQDEVEYQKKLTVRNLQVDSAKKELLVLDNALKKGKYELEETKKLLNKYYDLGVIYPKYRGIVPICQIYEYLESGRCFSLWGPGGAYNLYEGEVRSNLIISKLDDVISRLDDLSAGQQMLANVIRESNRKIDELSQSFNRVEKNTAVDAYYSRITAENTNYLSWLATWGPVFH